MCSPLNHKTVPTLEEPATPEHPLVQSGSPRDTLERVSQVLELMQHVDFTTGLDHKAQLGLFRIHQTLAESVDYVCGSLKHYNADRN